MYLHKYVHLLISTYLYFIVSGKYINMTQKFKKILETSKKKEFELKRL